jgi:hypothetical protein
MPVPGVAAVAVVVVKLFLAFILPPKRPWKRKKTAAAEVIAATIHEGPLLLPPPQLLLRRRAPSRPPVEAVTVQIGPSGRMLTVAAVERTRERKRCESATQTRPNRPGRWRAVLVRTVIEVVVRGAKRAAGRESTPSSNSSSTRLTVTASLPSPQTEPRSNSSNSRTPWQLLPRTKKTCSKSSSE